MSICPFCGTTYHSTYPPSALSKRQREIYDAVVASGPRGMQTSALLSAIYGDSPPKSAWGVLRVNVFEINRKIRERGQRIKGRRDAGYILVREGDSDMDTSS